MYKIFSLIILLISFTVEARWVTPEDASVEMLLDNDNITIHKDGTSTEIFERKFKILNEQGRSAYASYRFSYNGSISKIQIIAAYTIYDGTEYPVDLDAIEDKPIASDDAGFDQRRLILISFPKAEIGAELYLKFSEATTKTALPNFYNDFVSFGHSGCVNNAHTMIESELPLYLEINDPNKSLDISQSKKGNIQYIEIQNNKQICNEIVAGSEIGSLNDNKYTWVAISSINSWQEYAQRMSLKYQEVINQPLPDLLLPIFTAAKLEKDEIAQLNLVTSMVNEKIRYMGNWGTIDGKLFPRDLAVTSRLQEADCKEFSVITAAILQKLGYKVQVALITRGEGELSLARKLPNLGHANHALLKVTDKGGKVFWLDPTNLVSMAQGIFPDIGNKMLVILDSSDPSYERSASINPAHSGIIFQESLEIDKGSVLHVGELTLTGESALALTGQELTNSKEAIKDKLFRLLSSENLPEKNKKSLTFPDLNSRIVKDLKVDFEYLKDNELIKTNLGTALQIPANWSNELINYVPNQLADLYIGPMHSLRRIITLKNIRVNNIENLNYEINTPWLSFKRTCILDGRNSIIDDHVLFQKDFITSEELSSEAYLQLKRNIEENIRNVAVILE